MQHEGSCLIVILVAFFVALVFFVVALSTGINPTTALIASFIVFVIVLIVTLIKSL